MSREERRQRERQMKSMERGAGLPPAARARAERNAARRAARRGAAGAAPSPRRFWIRASVLAAAAGFLAFSFQWPNMPFALYLGIGLVLVVLALAFGFQFLRRRAGSRGSGPQTS